MQNRPQQALYYEETWSNMWKKIKEQWDKGYRVIDIEYGSGTWVTTFNESDIQQSIYYKKTWEDLWKKIKEKWDEDYRITDIEYGNGTWIVTLDKTDTQHKRQPYTSPQEWEKRRKKTNDR